MDFIRKLKETLLSVLPIVVIVLVLNWTIAPLGDALLPFLLGGILLVAGLTIFLTGTEIGMVPIGEKLGSVLANKRNLTLMMIVGFVIGFAVTFAEPDVQVLAAQVHDLNPSINQNLLVLLIAIGLGIFIDVGLLRSIYRWPLKYVFLGFYLLVFILVFFSGQKMASISFDASGATTGPMAVPFILAIGLGVSRASKEGKDNSFGLTGVASIGPIVVVCIMALLSNGSNAIEAGVEESAEVVHSFFQVVLKCFKQTAIGFGPLAAIIIFLQFSMLHFPRLKFRKICFGIVYSFIGIVIFLSGVEYGFISAGRLLGSLISQRFEGYVVVLVAMVFGAIVVCAEPAVWVLTEEVEAETGGHIKRPLVLAFLCIGVACSVALAMLRILLGINYLWFVFVGVGLALILSFFTPPLFTGIAFDSGGVASGPMATTFLLSFALGASGSADLGFGLVGLVAIAPLVAIQILGLIFQKIERKKGGAHAVEKR